MFGEPSASGGDGGIFTFVKEKKEKKDKRDKKDKRAKDDAQHDLDPNSNVMRPLGNDAPAAAGIFQSNGGSSTQLPSSAFSFELLGSSSSSPQQGYGVTSSMPLPPAAASIFGEQRPMTMSCDGGDVRSGAGVRVADDFEFDDRQEMAKAAAAGVAPSKPSDPLLAKLLHGGASAAAEAHKKAQSRASEPEDLSKVTESKGLVGGGGSKFFSSMLKAKAERAQRLESAASDRLRREGGDGAKDDSTADDDNNKSSSTRIKPMITAGYKTFLEEDVKRRAVAALKAATRKTDDSGENGFDDADDEPLGEAFNDLVVGKSNNQGSSALILDNETDDTFYFRSDWGLRVEKQNPSTTSLPSSSTQNAHEGSVKDGHDVSGTTSKRLVAEAADNDGFSSQTVTVVQSEISQKPAEEQIVLSAAVAAPQKSARERVTNIRSKRRRELEESFAALFEFVGRASASSISGSPRRSTRPAAELSGMASLFENDFYGRVATSLVA